MSDEAADPVPSAEKSAHAAMAALAQAIWDQHGVQVRSVRFDWLNVSAHGKGRVLVAGVDIDSRTLMG